MKMHRGISLVELLVAMSACTVILTLTAGLMHRVMHAQSRTRWFVSQERTALRLAYVFRGDVHQARAVVTDVAVLAERELVRLNVADQTITYVAQPGIIVRVVAASEKTVGREEFRIGHESQAKIRRESGVVILSVEATPDEAAGERPTLRKLAFVPPLSLEIAALPGRDLPKNGTAAPQEANP
jgi:hypothetical protein